MEDQNQFPPIVYKYRNWNDTNHQNVLKKNELYLSSPADFNDPFDCRIPENFYLLDTPEKINEYVEITIARHKERFIADGANINHLKAKMISSLINGKDAVQKKHEEGLLIHIDKLYGILSLSARWNSILMWSHYALNHTGYCVGFHEKKLRNGKLFDRGGMVNTPPRDDYPLLDPREDDLFKKALIQTHFKSRDWEYEQEYRLTKLFQGAPTVEDRKRLVPDDYIAEVIVGLYTSENDRHEIVNIAVAKGVKVFQAVKIPFKFLIDRIRIA